MPKGQQGSVCALVVAVLLGAAPMRAAAGATPEQECQKDRYAAAAKYAQCQKKEMGQEFAVKASADYGSKCRLKYAATWTKLAAKAAGTGSACDRPRFAVGATFVIDNLTGLLWERKSDDGGVHDKDDSYTWTAGGALATSADGPAFTTFLSALNTAPCFVGHCDWRLPTRGELETILSEGYPCRTNPCIEQDVFGPTNGFAYWSSTTVADVPWMAWVVSFNDGTIGSSELTGSEFVRAVRGGL